MSKIILLVEDEEHDVVFMRLAMEGARVQERMIVLKDGREAIAYFHGEGKYQDRREFPLPNLVLLDLKIPHVPGLEVLQCIRKLPHTVRTPVIVFSSSNQNFDIESAYKLGANAYVVKPGYKELQDVVRRVKQYWLDMDGPPPQCADWLSVTEPPPPGFR